MSALLPVREAVALDDGGLYGRARAGREECLARILQLPPGDPLRRASDGLAPSAAVASFVAHSHRSGADDDALRWGAVAVALEEGEAGFAAAVWRRIARGGWIDVRWPIFAALHVQLGSGRDTAVALADLLRELRLCPAAGLVLEDLVRRSSLPREVREWSTRVVARLGPS